MSLLEYCNEIKKVKSEITQLEYKVSQLNKDMVAEYAPVKIGWIIEDSRVRIRVSYVTYNGEFWTAKGPALTKSNKISDRHTGIHSINIVDLNGPRNSVKVISK